MSNIKGIDIAISVLGHWNPADLAFVEFLEYTAQTAERKAELILVGVFQSRQKCWPSENFPFYKVKIRFLGIRQFYLKEFGGLPTQIFGFEIINISDRGWENISFSIGDSEHDRIRFFCEEIEITHAILVR